MRKPQKQQLKHKLATGSATTITDIQ